MKSRRFRTPTLRAALAACIAFGMSTLSLPASVAHANDNPEWLRYINAVRAQSGLDPVTINHDWDRATRDHSCYMAQNELTHYETAGKPGYTEAGAVAGRRSVVAYAVDVTEKDFIDNWLTGPFHARSLLSPGWRTTSLGLCSDPDEPRITYATLEVNSGNVPRQTTSPIVFPGPGATTHLRRHAKETPDPRQPCGYSGSTGLPLVVRFPREVNKAAASVIAVDENGRQRKLETCVLYRKQPGLSSTYTPFIGANSVVVMIRTPLETGTHHVKVSAGTQLAAWSFHVDRATASAPSTVNTGGTTTTTPPPTTTTTPNPAVPIKRVYCSGKLATIVGTSGDDVIRGTRGDDVIAALSGNDIVHGLDGDDMICAGNGDDVVTGGRGYDRIFGQAGDDYVRGNQDIDRLYGGGGNDKIGGGSSRDLIFGGEGNDYIDGSTGDDLVAGQVGDDVLLGNVGNDALVGGEGRDILFGAKGNDWIGGGGGNDLMAGGKGDDLLVGNGDTDLAIGGDQVDTCRAERMRRCER